MFFNTVGTLFAGTTGTINGTITNSATKLPLAGVTVDAVSPTGHYSGTTNAQGFFAFNGVSPDTYTVSFELKGFTPASFTGINVFADQTQNVSTTLAKSLAGENVLEVHPDLIPRGSRVVIHDDVLATGGTVEAIAGLVERLGGVVVGACFIIELTFLGGREKLAEFDLHSLISY